MSVTAKDQYEDLLIERNELRRELEKAETESAEARGNVEKALRELSEEVAKRHKVEAKCAEMRSCIAWLNSHRQSPLETAWNDHVQHALSTDCGKDYVPKAELDAAKATMQKYAHAGENLRALTAQLVEALKALRNAIDGDDDDTETWNTALVTADEALAAAKEVL